MSTSSKLQEFTDKLIEEEELSADQKDAFKVTFTHSIATAFYLTCELKVILLGFQDFLKEKVREAKKGNREVHF